MLGTLAALPVEGGQGAEVRSACHKFRQINPLVTISAMGLYIAKDLNDGTPPITNTVMILTNSSKRVGLDSLEGC
jgi:hypothetical protein